MSNETDFDCSNLYIQNLWETCTQLDLDDMFKPYGIILQSRVCSNNTGFVRFENSEQAFSAMNELNGTKPHTSCVKPLSIKYAYKKSVSPKSAIKLGDDEIQLYHKANSKNVYIRGLPEHFTEVDLYNLCKIFGIILCIKLLNNGSGFIRYLTCDGANSCIHSLHSKFLPNSRFPLLVKLANRDPFELKVDIRTQKTTNEAISLIDKKPASLQRATSDLSIFRPDALNHINNPPFYITTPTATTTQQFQYFNEINNNSNSINNNNNNNNDNNNNNNTNNSNNNFVIPSLTTTSLSTPTFYSFPVFSFSSPTLISPISPISPNHNNINNNNQQQNCLSEFRFPLYGTNNQSIPYPAIKNIDQF